MGSAPLVCRMIVIIDYGLGNVQSVRNAIEYLGCEVLISRKEEDIRTAEKLILPGVGAFIDGMNNIEKFNLKEILYDEVIKKKKPLLCICLGMQLLAKDSEEGGYSIGLGWINANVKQLEAKSHGLKLPHIGWDNIKIKKEDAILNDIPDDADFYFVHSYHLVPQDKSIITATCEYGEEFVSTIHKDNIFAVQFHPEKSQNEGLHILKNFMENA